MPDANNKSAGETRFVRLELPIEIHDRLRVLAAEARQAMSQYVRQLVETTVKASTKGKPQR